MHFQGFSGIADIFVVGWTAIIGLVFGILYLKTKNILTPIFAHIAYNGITVILVLLSGM